MEYRNNNNFSSAKPFDELSDEEQKERIKESALSDNFSWEDANYMADRFEKF